MTFQRLYHTIQKYKVETQKIFGYCSRIAKRVIVRGRKDREQ